MPENENNAQQPTTGQKILSGIGKVAKMPGIIPSVIGGLVMGGSALYQKLIGKIEEFSQKKVAQQDVLNKMVADGYKITGKIPKWLQMPSGGVQQTGAENSINPKPTIMFNDKTGSPILGIRSSELTHKKGTIPFPLYTEAISMYKNLSSNSLFGFILITFSKISLNFFSSHPFSLPS